MGKILEGLCIFMTVFYEILPKMKTSCGENQNALFLCSVTCFFPWK